MPYAAHVRCNRMADSDCVVRSLNRDDWGAWNALVEQSPEGTIYHDYRWLDVIGVTTSSANEVFGIFQEGRLVGGFPLQVRRKGPVRIALRPFGTPYSGLVRCAGVDWNPGDWERLFDSIRCRFVESTLTFSPYSLQVTAPTNWTCEEKWTYLLNVGDPEEMWSNFSFEVRNRIRKALKSGIEVRENSSPENFYDLYKSVFANQGKRIPFTKWTFSNLLTTILEARIGTWYIAYTDDSKPVAAALFLIDSKRCYYSFAASAPELRRIGAPSLLVWRAIQDLSKSVQFFDFGGANIPSIAQFKSKFNGAKQRYMEYRTIRGNVLPALLAVYRKFKASY